jgi:cobalamin synthase
MPDKERDDTLDDWIDKMDAEDKAEEEKTTVGDMVSDVGVKAVPALKGMLAEMTILPVKASDEDREVGYSNPSMLPLVGFLFGLAAMIILWVVAKLEGIFNAPLWPIFALLAVATSMLIFRFSFLGDLARFGDMLFPQAAKDSKTPLGGIAVLVVCVAASVAMYITLDGNVGSEVAALAVGLTEICILNAMVCTRSFAESGFKGKSMAMSTLITIVGALIITLIWMILVGDVAVMHIIVAILTVVFSIIGGFAVGYISKRSLGYVPDDAAGAAVELTRPILVFLVVFFFWALNRGPSRRALARPQTPS